MIQSTSIELILQPPSPIINLPPIKSVLPDVGQQEHCLPTIKLNKVTMDNKLKVMEPNFDNPSPCSSYQSSPLLTCSSSNSTASSPLLLPLNDNNLFLLPPPPDTNNNNSISRRSRSLSNNNEKHTSQPCTPILSKTRSLSEPPPLDLSDSVEVYYNNTIFGQKRKRGRPPNTTLKQSKSSLNNNNITFIKPTVWDIKNSNPTTFTTTSIDIPKRKRGRKPKNQLAGNSCFVWKDLTAPRGANKKTLLNKTK